jgi:ribosomal protein S18 acetylase RimI-like enzyme
MNKKGGLYLMVEKLTTRYTQVLQVPLYHLDLSDLKELYRNFDMWLKSSGFYKECVSVYYQNFLKGFIIYDKKENSKYFSDKLKVYKISTVFVDKDFRNNKVGSYLLDKVISEIFCKRCGDLIYAAIHETNVEALRLFMRYGFKRVDIKETTGEWIMALSSKDVDMKGLVDEFCTEN